MLGTWKPTAGRQVWTLEKHTRRAGGGGRGEKASVHTSIEQGPNFMAFETPSRNEKPSLHSSFGLIKSSTATRNITIKP